MHKVIASLDGYPYSRQHNLTDKDWILLKAGEFKEP
jgi:hypothetical protein